jgi:hypothetical protein
MRCSSQHRLYSRDQFTYREWLGDVVISAQLESHNFVDLLSASGQHDNRQRRTF